MTDAPKNIQGAGGGGGGGGGGNPPPPPAPTRTPDTLHSRQFATFLDLISEGEIEGFETPSKEGHSKGSANYNRAALKDVFLNDTPILRSQASSTSPQTSDFNFQDVGFKIRFGTANQTKLSGILSSSSIQAVNVTVQQGSPVTRQITNTNVDAVNVTITFPQMQEAKENGDLLGSSVTLQIQVQYNGGGFSTVITDTITGRTADAYQRDYRINLTGAFPVDIRVVRVTPNSTSSSLINSFNWTSFGEIIDDASTYANSAYTSLRLDSMQFQSIPTRKFRIRGIKVRIPGAGANNSGTPTVDSNGRIVYPSNYVFNGTMGAAQWCACPAMVLLDILTDTRYGLGNHIGDSAVDLFSFVTASKFANTLVSDGFGGQEARFSCNVNIQAASEAFDIINELAGTMRCMPIWSAGTLSLAQDSPKDASYLFTLANVTPEGFSYSGSSLKTRHTVVSVSYFNMDTREIDFEVVEDAAAIAKFGVIIKQVKAFACTSRGQAARLGRAVLFTEQNESEIVTFGTSIDSGIVVRPGAVIEIADPVRSGVRRGGRIKSATASIVTVDSETGSDLDLTNNAKLSVILPDGTAETRVVSGGNVGGEIQVSPSFSAIPNANSVWVLENDTVKTQKFRVITVEESDGVNYAITALSYVDEKYAFIEDGSRLPDRTISILNLPKDAPSGLVGEEKLVVINNQAVSKLIISWQPVTGVTQYQVNYRFNNGNFVSTTVSSPDFEVFNTSVGTYEIQVFSYNTALQLSPTSSNLTINTVGKTAVPDNVSGLTIEPFSEKLVRLRWNVSSDLDVTHGGFVYVRHSTKLDGTGTFANSIDLIDALPGNSTQAVVPLLEGEYILKFQDDGGRFSTGETSVVIDLPDNVSALVTQTRREDLDNPKFQGTKTNTTFDASAVALTLTDPATNPSGEYAFNTVLDLGGVFSLDLKRHFLSQGFYIGTLFDSRTALIDTWTDFDGAEATAVNAKLLVATTQDDPSGSPTFTAFQTFANGTYKGRGFKFKTQLTSGDPAQNIRIIQLGYTATLQRRVEQSNAITANGSTNVTFNNSFFVGTSSLLGANSNLPSIGITAQNLGAGEFFPNI